MIVQFGQPSPLHVHFALKLNVSRSVGTGIKPSLWETISSNIGETLSNAVPFSSMIGPRWNSTLSMAIFGTSATMVLLSALAKEGFVSVMTNCALVGVISTMSIFIRFTLHSASPSATFLLSAVVWDGCHVFYPADPHPGPCQPSD